MLLTIVFFSSKDAINNNQKMDNENKYVGIWVTKDGYIRHELLPNNRYDEARGNRKSAYQGDYKITGDHIDYKDDTGFIADGDFKNDILYHAGMILYREKVQ
ncbi:Atu4866 domain-containing protein [Flavobacterium sp.]|uniref:Atu4866 domain-containing protein n=1 Tax=Flavobacterium sp. TaxID=239 RepID=UPI00374D5226